MNKIPVIDRAECTDCESCLNMAPSMFRRNEETGCIEIVEAKDYPETVLQEIIPLCPGRCIGWEEDEVHDRRPEARAHAATK